MKYILAFEGIIIGIIAGTLAIIYRLAMTYSESTLTFISAYESTHTWAIAVWFGALALMGLVVGLLVKWEPMIAGSGIPQVEGELQGYFKVNWLRVIVGKVIGGIICMFGGLSLGREGPSVQLGAMGGKGFSKIFKRINIEERYLITCGASAGLAAAFNAPLAGTIFALEEIHKNFSATILFSAMTASITADFVSKYVFGLSPVFHFTINGFIPLEDYWLVVILGVLLGFAGVLYNAVLLKTQALYGKIKGLKAEYRPMIPFILAGLLGLTMPQVLGGGNTMIQLLGSGKLVMTGMLALLAVKFIFSMLSFGSGAPGGIFFPLLVLGAYIGGIFGTVAAAYFGIDPILINNFVIIAMAGYFAAIVRAPITGIVLITEMTGSFDHLLALSVVVITAELTAGLLHGRPIYDALLDRILEKRGEKPFVDSTEKILISMKVRDNAMVCNQLIADIKWPEPCLLVSILRGGREIIPKGDTVICALDTLVALTDETNTIMINEVLMEMCEEPK
ncbi:ClC family H(+)/Cl(-) exchange transporter [Acetobacterium paludosum]|uniref:ClC family H(+)/Cl(-) exchange transporter n=2 Tax=Acetobacterium paludosum TaxID=52693 RepID=A0A923HUA7_9FIRM|nr:ClC family H(+)/Cl(-) exchange transporter [Acetobacterium paludosum]MBC3887837.1 ClC family H(+)/Cl(-) exchange transporter [Acetobacterium paludosum]